MFQKQLRFLFGLQERVTKRPYFYWGVGLFILKYLGECGIYYLTTGLVLPITSYLSPLINNRYPGIHPGGMPDFFGPAIILWTLPFLWIGVSMSIRRAADAGFTPWVGVLFFVPIVHYMLIGVLVAAPSADTPNWGPIEPRIGSKKFWSPMMTVIVFSIGGLALAYLTMEYIMSYAISLFIGFPLILGLVQSYLLGAVDGFNLSRSVRYVFGTVTLIYLLLLIFALEGVVCLVMAWPLSMALALMGAILGHSISKYSKLNHAPPMLMLLALPVMPWLEASRIPTHHDVVLSRTHIAVPPEKVWPNVVQFSELPPATEWLFHLGVAHPVRARIEGQGPGAVRYCEFSTGAFVEPITVWDEPKHLAFDVRYQPQPMTELSFYDSVNAPHLNGFFRSVRGEFQLHADGNGGTWLEGRTWYDMDIHPGWYWQIYGRWFIHMIHNRVLNHIKTLSET
jgi:uncharacterized membrane protein YhaH (DUF805 family)